MTRGKYIVLEGIDGSGKTTQFEQLAARLPQAITVREPGGTPMGESVRALLKAADIPRTGMTNAFLFAAARAELIATVVRPALLAGHIVLSDRNWLSSVAYQGAEGGPTEEIIRLNQLATKELFTPDLLILIDTPPQTALARVQRRAQRDDYFERKGHDYFARVRRAYHAHLPLVPRHSIINGAASIDAIADQIWQVVSAV